MQGALYIAFGDRHKAEARRSMASLRRASPDLPIAVITDRAWEIAPLPDRFLLRETVEGVMSKNTYAYDSPFEETLYLDTDTVVARDVAPVFGLLQHYDFGVRFYGPQLNEPGGLTFHTQVQSGVLLFKKNPRVEKLFSMWREEYVARARSLIGRGQITRISEGKDQRPLAIVLARSEARVVHLAEYLNFTVFDTITTYSPPVIYHGRLEEMESLDQEISGRWDTRVDWRVRLWLPNIRGLLPAGVRRSDPLLALALILRRAYNSGRRFLTRALGLK